MMHRTSFTLGIMSAEDRTQAGNFECDIHVYIPNCIEKTCGYTHAKS